MSTRILIVATFVLAAVAIVALVIDGSDDESVSKVSILSAPDAVERPTAPADRPDRADDVARLDVPAVDGALEALDARGEEAAAGPRPEGRITGLLVDEDGTPIAGEPVAVALVSDLFGEFEPDDDDPWQLVARAASGDDGRFSVAAHRHATQALVAGGTRWPRVRFEPVVDGDDVVVRIAEAHTLRGVVVDEATDLPVAGASVAAGADGALVMVTSDAEGRFTVGPVPGRDVFVAAWAPGHDVVTRAGVAPVLGEVELALGDPRVVEGRVIDADSSEPITSGEVVLRLETRAFTRRGDPLVPDDVALHEVAAPIAADGTFTIEQGVSRGFVLDATAPGHFPSHYDRYRDRELRDEAAIVVRMRPRVEVTGTTVVEATGLPLPGARVALEADDGVHAETTSGADGTFALAFPDDWDGRGRIHLHAEHPDGLGARAHVRAMTEPQTVALVPGFVATVRVVDGEGPVASAEVAVMSASSETSRVATGADGEVDVVHHVGEADVERVVLVARHGERRSLPLRVRLDEHEPDTVVELDLDAGAALTGLVTDAFGVPVHGALVRVAKGPLGHTDADGRFALRPVLDDEASQVFVTADGFAPAQDDDAWPDDDVIVELTRIVDWTGRVVDVLAGAPIEGFVGTLQVEHYVDGRERWRDTGAQVRRVSGEPGAFEAPLAEAGRYRLVFEAEGFLPATSEVVEFDGLVAPPPADVALAEAAVFDAVVVDTFGRPVPGVTVLVSPWEVAREAPRPNGQARKQGRRRRTDADGVARFELGQGGAFRVALRRDGWFDDRRLDVLPGYPAEREYRVPATGTLELTVVDEDGAPAPGTRVTIRSERGSRGENVARRPLVRSPDGVLRVEGLPAGTYALSLRNRRYDELRDTVTLAEGQFLPERFVLPPRGSTAAAQGAGGKGGGNQAKGGQGGGKQAADR